MRMRTWWSLYGAARAGSLPPTLARSLGWMALAAGLSLGVQGCKPEKSVGPRSGAQLYVSPQVDPIALSGDGTLLYVANTTAGSLSVVDVSDATAPVELAEIKVGHDPTGVAVRPGLTSGGDEIVLVANHVSDSISVVSRNRLEVIQTIQELDADGVTLTNEPVAVEFAGPARAFVTLDEPNQVLVLDVDPSGTVSVAPQRLGVTAQAPRALAAASGKLYVAAFESGNQTELPICSPDDDRGLLENDSVRTDEGCEFAAEILQGVDVDLGAGNLNVQLGTIFQFAAVNPNVGGRVIRDTDIPDRDLYVFDAATLQLEQVIEHVSTLLNGIVVGQRAGAPDRVYLTSTEALNQIDGLGALDNHLWENRLSMFDCGVGGCSPATHVDLDLDLAQLLGNGQTFPNPYGIAVSADGLTLVATAARADGDPGDGRAPMHGLFTLSASGEVRGSALVGALPEGVALRSGPGGRAETAFVLNTADSTISVVDVSDPTQPQVLVAAFEVGDDPTPPEIRLGRIAFEGARASTNGTFACGSCHPNGNMDQLQWTINTVEGPDDGAAPNGDFAEPRTTMPIRGLRDTLPLHWEGNLSDPFDGVNANQQAFDTAPDCGPYDPVSASHEKACVRHLVDAALSGPMCQHNLPGGCAPGPGQLGPDGANLPGGLTETERDAMAAYQLAVAFPPPPARRPTDVLSPTAMGGVSDFFTNEDGLGINDGVGQVVNFAPTTCADNPMGCHSLPLTVSTNSSVVGGFDAPSARGMWDRFTLFSNGITAAEEVLRMSQDCADGIEPLPKNIPVILGGGEPILLPVTGDPCNLDSAGFTALLGAPIVELPFPSGEQIYDPAVGMTERGSFIAIFEQLFSLVYGVRGDRIWQYQLEFGTGLPGLTGRQWTLTPANATGAESQAWLDLFERMADEGRITAVATLSVDVMRYDPGPGAWRASTGGALSRGELVDLVVTSGRPVTITADLPAEISIGGVDRQPLLDIDPAFRLTERQGDPPTLPRPPEHQSAILRLWAQYVEPGASILVNGVQCSTCSFVQDLWYGMPVMDLTLDPGLPAGVHVLQVLNPNGWASNELPICVTNDVDICVP